MYNEYRFICNRLGSRRVLLIIGEYGYAFGDMADELRGRIGTHLWLVEDTARIGVALTLKRTEELGELLDCYVVQCEDVPPKWVGAFERAIQRTSYRK